MKFGFAENSDNAIDTSICTPEIFENLMVELGDEVRDWCKPVSYTHLTLPTILLV